MTRPLDMLLGRESIHRSNLIRKVPSALTARAVLLKSVHPLSLSAALTAAPMLGEYFDKSEALDEDIDDDEAENSLPSPHLYDSEKIDDIYTDEKASTSLSNSLKATFNRYRDLFKATGQAKHASVEVSMKLLVDTAQ